MDIPSIILSVLIAVVVTALVIVYRKQRQRSLLSHGMVVASNSDEESYLQASERDYGVPDEVVSVHTFGSPTYEPPLLFYADFVVVAGQKLTAGDITDVTFNNRSNPYTTNDYQVVITCADGKKLSIAIGNDIDKAKYIVQLLSAVFARSGNEM